MAGRSSCSAPPGYTGRLTAEAHGGPRAAPGAGGAHADKLRRLAARARRRAGGGRGRRRRSAQRSRAGGAWRRARHHRGAVRALRGPGGRGSHHRGRPLPGFHRRAAVHPRGVRALWPGGRAGEVRDAHRVRLRLGAREPRRRRSRSSGRATGRCGWTPATSSPVRGSHGHERRHPRLAGGGDGRARLRLPRRHSPPRARGQAAAHLQRWAPGRRPRCRSGARSTTPFPACRPTCAR